MASPKPRNTFALGFARTTSHASCGDSHASIDLTIAFGLSVPSVAPDMTTYERARSARFVAAGADRRWDWKRACAWLKFGVYRHASHEAGKAPYFIVYGFAVDHAKRDEVEMLRALLPFMAKLDRIESLDALAVALHEELKPHDTVLVPETESSSSDDGLTARPMTLDDIRHKLREALGKMALGAEYLASLEPKPVDCAAA